MTLLVAGIALIVSALGVLVATFSMASSNSARKWCLIVLGVVASMSLGAVVGNVLPRDRDVSQSNSSTTTNASPSGNAENPSIEISSFNWITDDGQYSVSGTVQGLAVNQVVWSYNEAHDLNTQEPVGRIYPDVGPCLIERDTFRCSLGYAGNGQNDKGRVFTVYVAILNSENAYDAASLKANYNNRDHYEGGWVSVPRAGQDLFATRDVQHR